jgi:hypothetical protein
VQIDRLVNRLIESPVHHVMPRALTRIAYIGPLSGSAVCLPVQSVADGNRFIVVAGRPEQKRWWRAFRRPHPARLTRAGNHYNVSGLVLTGRERSEALATYLDALPRGSRGIGAATPVIALTAATHEAGLGNV